MKTVPYFTVVRTFYEFPAGITVPPMLAATDMAMDLRAQRQKKRPYLSYTIHIAASISVYEVLRCAGTQQGRRTELIIPRRHGKGKALFAEKKRKDGVIY